MAKYNQAMEDFLRYNAAILPQKRSTFNKSHGHTTTGDSGYIIPLTWDRVLPGDEKKIRYSGLVRMTTPLHPVMDEAKFDVACFFVPDRLVWEHAREFYGENKDASFNPDGMYVMPYLKPSQYGVVNEYSEDGIGSLSDYLGFPLIDRDDALNWLDDIVDLRCTGLLHRAYHLIYNYFYRNSSVQQAEQLSTGDQITDSEWNVIKKLKLACKFPDYFTSLLREPQAGDDVLLPLGDKAPVVTGDVHSYNNGYLLGQFPLTGDPGVNWRPLYLREDGYTGKTSIIATDEGMMGNDPDNASYGFKPSNLWADLTSATAATINNLRAAVTVSHLLEIDASAGKRYQQILQAHWGVFTPDGTLQQPEILGLCRQTVGMRQVLQTSATVGDSPLGDTAAFSLTSVSNEIICDKAFTEPGVIMVLGVIRPVHSYSQGLDPLLQKLYRYDHYWPVFNNLGNQPVYGRNIYCSSYGKNSYQEVPSHYDDVLGYAEAWTEYRIKNNRVSGLMRPDAIGTLASWNYSSCFDETPVLNSAFVEEDPELIDRTIAVKNQPQFLIDSYFDYYDTKNMSVHSIPGITRL